MTEPTIAFDRVTKRYGGVTAVSDLSFHAHAGRVTGFLGPNGAGKTTALRILLGLAQPTEGSATIQGRPYAALAEPSAVVGALLDANTFHPWRSARNQLRVTAAAAGIEPARVDRVLADVDLDHAARRRVGGFSLGMRQRLGLAGALLGDPEVLILDEPTNGLDPEGIRWLRGFLLEFARRGRTVLISSHNLAEVEQTVDDVVIIASGRLRAHCTLDALRARTSRTVEVRTRHTAQLRGRLSALGIDATVTGPDALVVAGTDAETIGEVAALGGIPLFAMTTNASDFEALFFDLTTTTATTEVPA